MEDLMEAIPLRRTALELAPPGHQEHCASLVHLVTCLEQRFSNEGAMEDLTEVIALRRAILKLTPAAHKEHRLSLGKLADCLDLQYFKSGGTLSVLEEIISLQRARLACNPSSPLNQAMIETSIRRCLGEKYHRQRAKPPVIDFAPPARKRSICDPIFPHPTSLLLNPRNQSGIFSEHSASVGRDSTDFGDGRRSEESNEFLVNDRARLTTSDVSLSTSPSNTVVATQSSPTRSLGVRGPPPGYGDGELSRSRTSQISFDVHRPS
ncbi:hypothetical protein EV401DRAFT_804870 [Pisolithus croceorrhizus]|nr:hypothetical protein EV401DRAFT_804870 [Pisolithus croceorrhizus]